MDGLLGARASCRYARAMAKKKQNKKNDWKAMSELIKRWKARNKRWAIASEVMPEGMALDEDLVQQITKPTKRQRRWLDPKSGKGRKPRTEDDWDGVAGAAIRR
jgi:hypothetical protein